MVSILGGNLQINFFFSNLVEKNSLIVSKCRENGIDRLRNGKLRRRRQGQRRLILPTNLAIVLKSFPQFITVKIIAKLTQEHSGKFEIKISKLSRRVSRSPDNAECGHFTLLFCRGRQRNVPRIITHVHRHCSAR